MGALPHDHEGVIDHLIPIHSEEYVASKYFEYAGKLIAYSVVHAGFGLVGLSKAIVHYLVEDDLQQCLTFLSVEDIPDIERRNTVKEVIWMWFTYKNLELLCHCM